MRPSGIDGSAPAIAVSNGMAPPVAVSTPPRRSGVSMVPGQTQLTVIWCAAISFAKAWVKRMMPAFAVRDELVGSGLRAEENALEVHRERSVPRFLGHVDDGDGWVADAGVVD